MNLVTVSNPDAPAISHVSSTPIDVAGGVDTIALGTMSPLPIGSSQIYDPSKQRAALESIRRMPQEYPLAKTYDEQSSFISNAVGAIGALNHEDLPKAAEYLSQMVDSNGTKLFESREEAMRFVERTRGMRGWRGLSRRELYDLRRRRNRRAIFFNTVNKTLPPEEVTKIDSRYYVDMHPLPYLF